MIAITDPNKLQEVSRAISRSRGEPHIINISYEGVETRRLG